MVKAAPELNGLYAPFDEVKTREQAGRTLSYITARQVMNRLDDVVGPANWADTYRETDKGVVCALAIRVGDEWLSKSDAGGYSGMVARDKATGQMGTDEENDVKTAYSDAFKRAAVKWGVGRYLYPDGVPEFAADQFKGHQAAAAMPGGAAPPPSRQPASPSKPSSYGGRGYGDPKSGKALFSWIKQQESETGEPVLELVNNWAKREHREWPKKMIDWMPQQVAEAFAAAKYMLEFGADAKHGDGNQPA